MTMANVAARLEVAPLWNKTSLGDEVSKPFFYFSFVVDATATRRRVVSVLGMHFQHRLTREY
jgi:hypothetical protein